MSLSQHCTGARDIPCYVPGGTVFALHYRKRGCNVIWQSRPALIIKMFIWEMIFTWYLFIIIIAGGSPVGQNVIQMSSLILFLLSVIHSCQNDLFMIVFFIGISLLFMSLYIFPFMTVCKQINFYSKNFVLHHKIKRKWFEFKLNKNWVESKILIENCFKIYFFL